MKLTVFALISGLLCLVAVTANASGNYVVDHEDIEEYEYMIQAEEIIDIEPYGIFSGMFSVFKKALRTLKGLNCTIKEVLAIETAAQNFVDDVKACGGEVSQKVQKLIDACNDIISTCKAILGINESICGNTIDEDTADTAAQTLGSVSGASNAHKCFVKMLRKLQTLKKQIKRALDLINQIHKVPADTNACVTDAIDSLEKRFTQFPANVKNCSKLTS